MHGGAYVSGYYRSSSPVRPRCRAHAGMLPDSRAIFTRFARGWNRVLRTNLPRLVASISYTFPLPKGMRFAACRGNSDFTSKAITRDGSETVQDCFVNWTADGSMVSSSFASSPFFFFFFFWILAC